MSSVLESAIKYLVADIQKLSLEYDTTEFFNKPGIRDDILFKQSLLDSITQTMSVIADLCRQQKDIDDEKQ